MQNISGGPIGGGFGSGRIGLQSKPTGNNKLNSFRGGPIKAVANALDNSDFLDHKN